MVASYDIFSLYANTFYQPSDDPGDSPSYLDFVRTMNDGERRSPSPPPPYSPPPPPQRAELPCPYSALKLKALRREESERQARPTPLQVIYAHIIPLPTICVTPPASAASSPTRSGTTDSPCFTVFSPTQGAPSATWPAGPPLRRKHTPHLENLREVRQRESERSLREVYERQTRQFFEAARWTGTRPDS
jgi:hypothetical protein